MAEEQAPGQVIFDGFHQGSVMEDGVLGPVKSYIALRNTGTGRVLNVEIAEASLAKVVSLAHGDTGDLPVEESADIAHPSLDVDPESTEGAVDPQPAAIQEEPTPDSAFPGEE